MKKTPTTIGAALLAAIAGMAALPASAQWARVLTTSGDRLQQLKLSSVQASGSSTSSDAIIITDKENQHIDGFGYALTYSACYNLMKMPADIRNALLKKTFSPSDGYGVSYVRISIGTSDFASGDYSLAENGGNPDPNLNTFALQSDETDYVIPILKEVLRLNPNLKIMAAPWTCPTWMKNPDNDGNKWNGGRLKSEYYQVYGQYFVKFIQAMKQNGIDIYAVSPQNEPLNGGNSASVWMAWWEMKDFVKDGLAPALSHAGLKTKIYVWDHNYNYDNNSENVDYPFKIFDDLNKENFDGKELLVGSCWHNYGGTINDITNKINQYKDKEYLFTESSIGTWNDGRNLINRLTADMNDLVLNTLNNSFVGSIAWNFMLDMDRKPYVPGGCSTCYGAIDVDQNNSYRTYSMNSHYFIMAHASDAARVGGHRVDTEGWWTNGLTYSAFKNPDNTKSILFSNRNESAVDAKVQANGYTYTFTIPARGVVSAVMGLSDDPSIQKAYAVSATLVGTAAENGQSLNMHKIEPNGDDTGKFECFTRLNAGNYNFSVRMSDGSTRTYGNANGTLSANNNTEFRNDTQQLARVEIDINNNTCTVKPISRVGLTGSTTNPAWSDTNMTLLEYQGNGVWKTSEAVFSGAGTFVFAIDPITNGNWQCVKAVGSSNNVEFENNGYALSNIPCNAGTYEVKLDLNNYVYSIRLPQAEITDVVMTGTGAENGNVHMNKIADNVFECYTMLGNGEINFTATLDNNSSINYGVTDGRISANGAPYNTTAQIAIVKADFNTNTLTVTPITAMGVTGSITNPVWSNTGANSLDYIGNGIWRKVVDMDNNPGANDPARFIFIMNNDWGYQIKHVINTVNSVALQTSENSESVEDIYCDKGIYQITLDMNQHIYNIEKTSITNQIPEAASIEGTAAEGNQPVDMFPVVSGSSNKGLFEAYTMLQQGSFTISGITGTGTVIKYGISNISVSNEITSGVLSEGGAPYNVPVDQLTRILIDFNNNTISLTPITSMAIVGGFTPDNWDPTSNTPTLLAYKGNGIWENEIDVAVSNTDNPNGVFAMNIPDNGWSYLFKKVKGQSDKVGLESLLGADNVENVPNPGPDGKYLAILNLNNHTYKITSTTGIDEIETNDGLRVTTGNGKIVITCDGDSVKATVTSTDGQIIWSGEVQKNMKLDVIPGIYFVNNNKIMVK